MEVLRFASFQVERGPALVLMHTVSALSLICFNALFLNSQMTLLFTLLIILALVGQKSCLRPIIKNTLCDDMLWTLSKSLPLSRQHNHKYEGCAQPHHAHRPRLRADNKIIGVAGKYVYTRAAGLVESERRNSPTLEEECRRKLPRRNQDSANAPLAAKGSGYRERPGR